jgi:hypothetical protein
MPAIRAGMTKNSIFILHHPSSILGLYFDSGPAARGQWTWQLWNSPLSPAHVAFDGGSQSPDEQLVVEWFAQESQGAGGQRPLTHSYFIVGGDEDDGEPAASADQLLLNVQPVHPRHLNIKHETVRLKRRHRIDEFDKVPS